jgi:hypothetical protein
MQMCHFWRTDELLDEFHVTSGPVNMCICVQLCQFCSMEDLLDKLSFASDLFLHAKYAS